MLSKRNRLNLTHSFQKLRTTGKRDKIGPLTIFSRSEPTQTEFKASVVVPSSVTKLKPTRNRIRRLIYNNLRKNTARFPHSLQLVIMVYEDIYQWEPNSLNNLLHKLDSTIDKITLN